MIRFKNRIRVSGVPDGLVLYDTKCLLCSAWFRFVATRDPKARFRFVAIQDAYGRALAIYLGIDPDNPETNAVIIGDFAYLYSSAALQILRRLRFWSWTGLLLFLPPILRDFAYRLIASNRYRLFGYADICARPDPMLEKHLFPSDMPPSFGAPHESF